MQGSLFETILGLHGVTRQWLRLNGWSVLNYGMDKFRTLYALTPLVPGDRNAGVSSSRWQQIYGRSIGTLAVDWARTIRG